MPRTRHLLVLALLAGIISSETSAAKITSTSMSGGKTAIFVIGQIGSADSVAFRNMAQKYGSATVFLESDGGSTIDAIEIGKDIRLKGFSTAVINGSNCNSACALIWLAGTPRGLAKSAKIGFHATYTTSGGLKSESGVGNAIVGRYLTLLNLPEDAIIFATSAAPSQLNYLTAKNYIENGIDIHLIDDVVDESTSPVIYTESVTKKDVEKWGSAGDWLIYVDHTLQNGCFLLASYTSGTYFRIGRDPKNGGDYAVIGNDAWKSLQVGSTYPLQLKFGSNTPWTVPTIAIKLGDGPMLKFTFSDSNFWTEFSNSESLEVSRGSVKVVDLSLADSSEALSKLNECQRIQPTKVPRDPFAE